MSHWNYQSVSVGASGKSAYGIKPGAGVQGLISIGKNKSVKADMSPLGQTAVDASGFALSELANGNTAVAVTTAAGAILAATSYYIGQALDKGGTLAVASSAASAASSVSSALPVIQAALDQILQAAAFIDAREGVALQTAQTSSEASYFQTVSGQTGTGPYRQVVPADLFMGPTQNNSGDERGDVFELPDQFNLKNKNPLSNNQSQLAELLLEMEQPTIWPKDPIAAATAKKAFPPSKIGLLGELRSILTNLRKGMSSMYKNNLTGNAWTPDITTDGGASLWVPYIDLLNSQWRQGRLSYDYMVWRMLLKGDSYGGSNTGAAFAYSYAVANGIGDPTGYVLKTFAPSDATPTNKIYTASPWLFAYQGAVKKVRLMVDGWELYIKPAYDTPTNPQAADNPLHSSVPTGPRPNIQIRTQSHLGAWLLGGAALATLAYLNPSEAARAYNLSKTTIKKVF